MAKLTKQDLRGKILTLLRNQEEEERLIKSLSIKDKLFGFNEIIQSKTILFYSSFDGEVNTFDMIAEARKEGKRVALPKIDPARKEIIPTIWNDNDPLEAGHYGIDEPGAVIKHRLAIEDIDSVVVPGVAFDKNNNRLGRGAGYYDRFLAVLPESTATFGLGFDFQCVDAIPEVSDHDVPVSYVVHN